MSFKEVMSSINPPINSEDNQASNSDDSQELRPASEENTHTPAPKAGHHEEDRESLKAHQQHYQNFLAECEKLPDTEAKLQFAIDFMEKSLSQPGAPHFKSFWDARALCLELFKENIPPTLRSILWNKYHELSIEARRLKEILDEQSAFAVEQIEIAIKALEDDIGAFESQADQEVNLPIESAALARRSSFYHNIQYRLSLLNAFASRINSLRKELIRTDMRVRHKNRFFQRLSAAGDKVFPVRKDLIKQVSDAFIADVDSYIQQHFTGDEIRGSFFSLREEIKNLQNIAKMLTLNTHAFNHTRMRLSECWDKIKGEEKEKKKERAQLKTVYKQLLDESLEKLKSFTSTYAEGQLSSHDAEKQIEEMGNEFRNLDLGKDERQILRQAWYEARQPLLDKLEQEKQAKQQQLQERDLAKKQKIADLKQEVETFLKNSHSLDVDVLTAQRDALQEKIQLSPMSKMEKIEVERQLKPIRDLIAEKKESSLLNLSEGDRESLQQLREVLKQRKLRRQEIKDQIDALRKASGSSGLDFEQAMNQTTLLNAEKERLEKINLGIKEIEDKIDELIDQ